MIELIKKYFSSEKQVQLFGLLCLTTLLDITLVIYRGFHIGFDFGELTSFESIARTRGITFFFLIWNLVLAWIPYLIAISLEKIPAKKWLAPPAIIAWLVFFPNAPYIITDLLHVNTRPGVPLWYDVMVLFSFAWTGLLLGYLSLMEVQHFLDQRLGKKMSGLLVWASIGLCAFGVYLGRYQRWNTWDLLTNPYPLFKEMTEVLFQPLAYLGTLGLAVVMAGVLGVGYLTVRTLMAEAR